MGYGGYGYVNGAFTDDFSSGENYVEIDTDGDEQADYEAPIDGSSSGSNSFSTFVQLQPGEQITGVRVIDSVTGLATAWVAVGYVNQAPEIQPVADDLQFSVIYLEQDPNDPKYAETAIKNGALIVDIDATDPNPEDNNNLRYVLTQPAAFSDPIGKQVNFVARALDIDNDTGLITINNRDTLARKLRQDGKYSFTVSVGDHGTNRNGMWTTVNVTIYDDWNITYDTAMSYVGDWKSDADTYVNQVYVKSGQALDKLETFIDDYYKGFGEAADTSLEGISLIGDVLSAAKMAEKANAYVAVATTLAELASKGYAIAKKAGNDAYIKAIDNALEKVLDDDTTEIRHKRDEERNKLIALRAKTENNTTLDQRALQMMNQLETVESELHRTFDNDEKLLAPPVDTIYGELLMQYAAKKGFKISGSNSIGRSTGHYWEAREGTRLGLDAWDVKDELNEIDYRPLDTMFIKITGGVVVRVKRSEWEAGQKFISQ